MERKTLVKWCLLLLGALLSAQVTLGANNPILLVGTSSNQFSLYYSEVFRAEGLNAFDTADISTVTATTLSAYDVVVLGQMTLTSAQVTMFTNWVYGGGNLIVMRPDKQLATLLGLSDTGTTLSNAYLQVNTSTAPGAGIVGQTIQFHGTADLYVLNGASAVATLYSSATAATPYPAVALRTGIGTGGNAVAFTYDLAQSIVYTRQGDPAWAGEARVGQGGPVRAVDMYYGAATFDPEPDWVDLNNIAIPQADEQQRLLANIIQYVNQGKKPLPRFWYLPFGKKAAVIMTGDDHANGGTAGRFDDFIASSPAGCSVANWECVRGTSYVYPGSPLTNAQAASYTAQGFEVGLHVTTNCADFTPATLESFFATQLSAFAGSYPSLSAPKTNRTHCIAWSDWASEFQVELNHGIRLDTNYYYWPPSWVVSTPGFFTGSGMPMRFAQTDGTLVDVYQATTQMPDESGETFPDFINGLLDNAVGPAGFYGVFTANMHTDYNGPPNCSGVFCYSQQWADQIVASAQSHGVPVVSSIQMLQWLDGRNGSSFGSISWSGSTLTFTVTAAAGANGLQGMLPVLTPSAALSSLTQGGSPVSYSVQTIKGIQYAVFSATSGTYRATYGNALPPVITAVTATPGTTTATITWTTDRSTNSRVDYGTLPTALTSNASNAAFVTSHSISLTGLLPATTYYFQVTSADASGNSTTSPAAPATASFTTIDPTLLTITAVTAAPGLNGTATIAWTTSKLATSWVDYGTSSASLNLNASNATLVTSHSVALTGLAQGTTYYYRVTSVDSSNNSLSSPAAPNTNSFVENGGLSVWSSSAAPTIVDSGDSNPVELGLKFRSDVAGAVTGVRFYKASTNTGTHSGHLWTSTGTQLGTVTFTNESASGWQQANFATPISIAANTTYVVSYFAPNGHYSGDGGFFASAGVDNPPLHALANGVDGPNGVYLYGSTSGFPSSTWNSTNYWVDLVFTNNVPPVISAVGATTTATTATITWTTNEASNSRVDYGTTTALGTTVSTTTMVTAHSITLTGLTTGTVYYYRVTSVDSSGNSATSPVTTGAPASFTAVDTTPPVITAVAATPGTTTATITWTTDKNSTSRVDYGTSSTALTLNVADGTLVTSHSIGLTGLATGTVYYYRVTSVDSSGNSTTSPSTSGSPATFTTIDPTPPVISAVTSVPGLGGAATITWTTNKVASSRVDYGTSAASLTLNVSDATLVSSHGLTLTGLTLGATYYYRVTSIDASGNSASSPVAPAAASFIENAVSVWSPTVTPGTVDSGDASALEVGMKFRSDVAGVVTGVRFYKASTNTGTHTGHLWTSTGTQLGAVTFANETASGWQQANFATPISIAAGTTYVVSYFAPSGHYSVNSGFFTSAGVDNPPLHALATGVDGPNGVYLYGSTSGFPNQSYNASNYWVDLVFTDNVPPVISAVGTTTTATTATITWTTNESSNSRVDYGTTTALGTTVSNATMVTAHSITLTGLTTGTVYYYQVTSVDPFGNSTVSPATPASVTVMDTTPPVITAVTATPATTTATITWTTDKNSTSRVDYGTTTSLGTTSSVASLVTAHSVTLSGLAVGTTYYFRVTSVDGSGNSSSSPVAPATANFTTIDPTPPVISAVTAAPGTGGTATITWTTNKLSTSRVDYGTTTSLGTTSSVASLVTAHSITLSGLAVGTTYYYRVTSVDGSGNSSSSPVAPATASFIENAPVSVWSSSTTPGTVDSGDSSAVELGMKFRSDAAGTVTGVRFYKAAANTGTHSGHLWTSAGTQLGAVTFTNETASGWQQANFATPILIAANTTYVVSYFAPKGHYAANNAFFTSAGVDNPPLHALANGVDGANGVYRYGSTSGFPSSTYNASNYWVDLTFLASDATPPTVTAFTIPAAATSLTVSISSFTATDNAGVTGYMVTESAAAPSPGATGWTATAPASYTFTTAGTKTLYAWAKDAAANVSASKSASVVITLSDTTPPTVTAFTIPATATSLTVSISSFTATDNVGVTGYLVNESATTPSPGATGWTATAPASYTFTTAGTKTLYAWAEDAAGNVSTSKSASVVITIQATGPELAGWYAGDMHVHRSCGGSPETVAAMYSKLATNNLAVMSLLADMGNGEVQNATTDLPLVNGTDASVSTAGRIVHWDAEWHWDATYTQYAHQALGGHIVALGLTSAQQIWQEYTYPILNWAHQHNGIAGFAHLQYLDGDFPTSLTCCTPVEYPVEVALGAADFISEDVDDSGSDTSGANGAPLNPEAAIQAYYKLLNDGFRPGFAAGTDYPCNSSRPVGSLLTYVQPAGGQMTYQNWIQGIAKGRTVVSRNSHNEFLALTVNGTATPGDEIRLASAGTVTVAVQWTATQNLTGTIELVSNGVVVASNQASVVPGAPVVWNTTVNFPKSGWLAARRMGADGHQVHTAAVFVIVNNAPVRASASDAQYYVQWMNNLLTNTSPGGVWNSYFPTSLSQAQARYQAAKSVFQQIVTDAAGTSTGLGIFSTQIPPMFENDSIYYELGTKFWADVNGQITQVGLYTNASEGGSHTVRIWRVSDSTLLAGPYTWNITSGTEGWKAFTLPTPLSIVANTDYIVDISNSSDYYYAAQTDGFDAPIVNGHLHTYVGSGVYTTTLGAMPTSTWQNSNYFRDIAFVAQ